jgi:hypothetical protein
VRKDLREELERLSSSFWKQHRSHMASPVDVSSTADDDELDDHLWLRLADRTGNDPAEVAALPEEVRAYYATRAFESEVGSGGVDGFIDVAGGIGHLVADAYRLMNAPDAAVAFEALWASPTVRRLLSDDSYVLTDPELEEVGRLADTVGIHDVERIALVRRHPDLFSI